MDNYTPEEIARAVLELIGYGTLFFIMDKLAGN